LDDNILKTFVRDVDFEGVDWFQLPKNTVQ